ncbi:glycosyltransferase family 9 protein [Pseudobdellovibrio exovorus]|uniref:Heptosyltransferase n=1 Tax=Pseudobdellovibrio exovorus JSS TaxID=1184267 RepID=M4V9T6_9BACT|nr:glycosyltransferase family 9 protein [Pseudobdellovibrio exovorus]AGH95220.1 heptosyltransferase [Pseudobdellovibrio exovorus JSS]
MKILIIRFSSIGDLTQALSIPSFIRSYVPNAEIHFVTRQDLSSLLENHPNIDRIWTLDRRDGFRGLIQLIKKLNQENFTHIYDAHNNLRSALIRFFVHSKKTLVRPMMRIKRFLLLEYHINLFEKPFSGQRDLIKPLEKWGMPFRLPPTPQLFLNESIRQSVETPDEDFVALVPSAAYFLKRWPIEYWDELIKLNPSKKFVVLAGPEDNFTSVLNQNSNVLNLTGKTGLLGSAAVIEKASMTIANDTGLLHFSEQLGKPTIALMGPAPFGFPSRETTLQLERNLKCRPCSKHGQGPCVNVAYHECLRSITPLEVSSRMNQILEQNK